MMCLKCDVNLDKFVRFFVLVLLWYFGYILVWFKCFLFNGNYLGFFVR